MTANTESATFLSSATIVLDRADDSAELLLDTDGLYPGVVATGCVEIVYDGSVPATVRLHGASVGETGLERYIHMTLEASSSGAGCQVSGAGAELFDGRLDELWRRHGDYASGLTLVPSAEPGERLAIRARAEVVDDNRAQGLVTEFSFHVEARP